MPKAKLDLKQVMDQLKVIQKTSSGIAKALKDTLERIEENPDQFQLLDDTPPELEPFCTVLAFRKAYIVNDPHDFRLIFVHAKAQQKDDLDLCYGLVAFPRKRGYVGIDWGEMVQLVRDRFEVE